MRRGRDRPSFLSLFYLLFLFFSGRVHAGGIQFTSPPGGGTWPAGPITVAWVGAGGSPSINELVSYTLQLVVGGTTTQNSGVIATLDKGAVSAGQTQIIIASNVSASIQNGFYLMMTSTVNNGNQIINYSDRFTLIDLDGVTSPAYVTGAQAAAGITDVPGAQYNIISGTTTSSPTSAPTTTVLTSATPTGSPTSTTPPSRGGSGSSPFDLIIGLSIGLVFAIALIAIIGITALVRRRRKRRQARSADDALNDRAYLGDKVELPALSASPTDSIPVELSPYRRSVPGLHEMPEQDMAVEAGDRKTIRFELEGDWTGWEAGSGRQSQAYDPTR